MSACFVCHPDACPRNCTCPCHVAMKSAARKEKRDARAVAVYAERLRMSEELARAMGITTESHSWESLLEMVKKDTEFLYTLHEVLVRRGS